MSPPLEIYPALHEKLVTASIVLCAVGVFALVAAGAAPEQYAAITELNNQFSICKTLEINWANIFSLIIYINAD